MQMFALITRDPFTSDTTAVMVHAGHEVTITPKTHPHEAANRILRACHRAAQGRGYSPEDLLEFTCETSVVLRESDLLAIEVSGA